MNTTIRPAKASDKSDLRQVCLATTDSFFSKHTDLLWALYCDYYVDVEPHNCFVLADSTDRAVGYIMCAIDDSLYIKNFKPYLDKIKKLNFAFFVSNLIEQKLNKKFKSDYPAHLHIDILPEFQSKGHGSELMNALLAHLKSNNINGVRLGVGGSNTGAIRFYKRHGFKMLKDLGATKILGLKLN